MNAWFIVALIALAVIAFIGWYLWRTDTDEREQDYVPDGEDWNYRIQTVIYVKPT